MERNEYVERVLRTVERVPSGRVTTYGAIAGHLGVGGPRQVGQVMALHGGLVPWWRVVRADGSLPAGSAEEAGLRHRAEGTALRESGRVDLREAYWQP